MATPMVSTIFITNSGPMALFRAAFDREPNPNEREAMLADIISHITNSPEGEVFYEELVEWVLQTLKMPNTGALQILAVMDDVLYLEALEATDTQEYNKLLNTLVDTTSVKIRHTTFNVADWLYLYVLRKNDIFSGFTKEKNGVTAKPPLAIFTLLEGWISYDTFVSAMTQPQLQTFIKFVTAWGTSSTDKKNFFAAKQDSIKTYLHELHTRQQSQGWGSGGILGLFGKYYYPLRTVISEVIDNHNKRQPAPANPPANPAAKPTAPATPTAPTKPAAAPVTADMYTLRRMLALALRPRGRKTGVRTGRAVARIIKMQ